MPQKCIRKLDAGHTAHLNDDLHVYHVKHISTSSACTYDMAHSIYIRPSTHITTCSGYHPSEVELSILPEPLHLESHMLAGGGQVVLLVVVQPKRPLAIRGESVRQ